MLLFAYRFSRCADVFLITAAESTTESTANVVVNKYILSKPTVEGGGG